MAALETMSMGWSPEDAAVEAGEGEAAPEVLGEVMGEEEIAMEEGVTGEVVGAETVPEPEGRLSEQQPGEDVGAETVPEPGGRLPEQQPGDWLSLENGRRGAVQVVDNVVQGSGVDSHPALARGCLPAGVCCAWRVTLLSDDYYYVGVATSEVSLSGWLGGNGDVRSIYLRDDKKGTRAVTRPQYRKEECGQRLKAGNFIDFSYDGRRSLTIDQRCGECIQRIIQIFRLPENLVADETTKPTSQPTSQHTRKPAT